MIFCNISSVISDKGTPLKPWDYSPDSVTRACAKVWAGNLCRRDYNGLPQITCISTCADNFCNCDSRSPPPEQFRGGKVAYESPKKSTWSANDLLSCQAMAGVPGYETESELAVRRNQAQDPDLVTRGKRRRFNRRNSAPTLNSYYLEVLVCVGMVLLLWIK